MVGFDNIFMSSLANIGLAAVYLSEEIGMVAARLLLSRRKGRISQAQ
ncbi:hypothetical protein [Chelativorans salis]|uniref:Uncharacterized protein n=1 Tax=Chelativorans salis TaxID=2978478 RepID=A0ABT2LWJ4_9HYPH|nr:hypothetical protein [Chelativorans sp. EGI FJ00035]MCT7377968.1 hypothetical protein [Chelativorans sp. EGI FJ00035]